MSGGQSLIQTPREVVRPGSPQEGGGLVAQPHGATLAQQLARAMDDWTTKRELIVQYLADHLVEATYEDGGKIRERNDYYRYPGSTEWKLSQEGADKARAIAGLFTADPRTEVVQSERAILTLTCAVHIVESNGTIRGTGQGSATSAEKGFQKQKGKLAYEGDWRAAFHAIQSRALKRATVRGTEAALAFGDVFRRIRDGREAPRLGSGGGRETRKPADDGPETSGPPPVTAPETVRRFRGRPLQELETAALQAARAQAAGREDLKWVGYIDEELERRRAEAGDG